MVFVHKGKAINDDEAWEIFEHNIDEDEFDEWLDNNEESATICGNYYTASEILKQFDCDYEEALENWKQEQFDNYKYDAGSEYCGLTWYDREYRYNGVWIDEFKATELIKQAYTITDETWASILNASCADYVEILGISMNVMTILSALEQQKVGTPVRTRLQDKKRMQIYAELENNGRTDKIPGLEYIVPNDFNEIEGIPYTGCGVREKPDE